MHKTDLAPLALAVLSALWLSPRVAAQVDFRSFDKIISNAVANIPLNGSSVRMMQGKKLLHEKVFGKVAIDSVVPIASSSKWLMAAVIMTLLDEKKLALDDPVAKFLPAWRGRGDFSKITVRHCLNHSSGLPPQHAILNMFWIKISEGVDVIPLTTKLEGAPGSLFHYGQLSYQVAARVAEVAGGKPWKTLVSERIFVPLGMSKTDYDALGKVSNPIIAMAVRSSLRDYSSFVEMFRNGGLHGNKRILSQASVRESLKNQIRGLKLVDHPYPDKRPYGLGVFIDRTDIKGRTLQVSHQGALGFSPWIDLDRDQSGVFLVQDNFFHILPVVDELQIWLREQFQPRGVVAFGKSTPACNGPQLMRSESRPLAAESSFRIATRNVPPITFGILILGFAPVKEGFDFLGAKIYISPQPPPIFMLVNSSRKGTHAVTLPLAVAPKNFTFFAQYEWLNTQSCRGSGLLSASNAFQVTTQ